MLFYLYVNMKLLERGNEMHRGFELEGIESIFTERDKSKGDIIYSQLRKELEQEVKNITIDNDIVDGSMIQSEWFPQIKTDVFISHSHIDEDSAIKFSGWLYNNFGITSFIDSCVWGYSAKLLKEINNKYSEMTTNTEGTLYSYDKCNYAASHVNIMLANAIMKMIDRCECFMFLNSTNSIHLSEEIKEPKVSSPWIYMELGLSKYVRRRPLSDYREYDAVMHEEYSVNKGVLKVEYKPDIEHLHKIGISDLLDWKNNCIALDKYEALDDLYEYHDL